MYLFTKEKTIEEKKKIGLILSIICIIILLLRNIEIFLQSKKIEPEIIPFQICHFANFILLFAFLKQSKTMFLIAFCFNLPAAFLSIVFANSLENYPTLFTFRALAYLFGHMLIVGIAIWAFMVKFVKVEKKAIINSTVFIITLFFLSIPINNIFNIIMPEFEANYFYTLVPEAGTPLELFYTLGREITFLGLNFNPIYILLTMLIGFSVFFSMILLAFFLNKRSHSKQDASNFQTIS